MSLHATGQSAAVARTALVTLRRRIESDALDEYLWLRDAAIARANGQDPLDIPFSAFCARFREQERFPRSGLTYLSIDASLGPESATRHCGFVAFYGGSAESTEFGITIGEPEARGRGLGTHATVAALRWLWSKTAHREVYLHTLPGETAARRCFLRAGFQPGPAVLLRAHPFARMAVSREAWLQEDHQGRFAFAAAT